MSSYEEYKQIAEKIRNHKFSAPVVNEEEKSEYQKIADQIRVKKAISKKEVSFADTSWGNTLVKGLSNIPSDFIPLLRDKVEFGLQVLFHPVETPKMIGKAAIGALGKYPPNIANFVNPSIQKKEKPKEDEYIKTWNGIERELYNRYGTEESLKRLISEEPLHAIDDLVPLLSIAGKATGLTKLSKIATRLEPVNVTLHAATPKFLFDKLPMTLYSKALGIADTLRSEKVNSIIKLGIDDSLRPTFKSVEKIQSQIQGIERYKEILFSKTAKKIDVENIFKDAEAWAMVEAKKSPQGLKVLERMKEVKKGIIEANEYFKRNKLDAFELNDYKKKFEADYKKIIAASGELPFDKQIYIQIGDTIRNTLEEIVPELKLVDVPTMKGLWFNKTKDLIKKRYPGAKNISLEQLNEIQGGLMELRKIIAKETDKYTLKDFVEMQIGYKMAQTDYLMSRIGVSSAIGSGTGFVLGSIDKSSGIKMALGRVLNKMKAAGIFVQPNATLIRMGIQKAGDYSQLLYGDFYEPVPEKEVKGLFK